MFLHCDRMAWRACPAGNCGAHFLKQAFRVPGATIAGSPPGSVTTCGWLLVVVVPCVCVLGVVVPAVVAVVPVFVAPVGAVIEGTLAEVLVLSPPPQAVRVRAASAAAIANPMRIAINLAKGLLVS
jgi:hypothetical protein